MSNEKKLSRTKEPFALTGAAHAVAHTAEIPNWDFSHPEAFCGERNSFSPSLALK
jgi:hypothetical protein